MMFVSNVQRCRLCRKSSGSYIDIFKLHGTKGLIVWKVIPDLLMLDVNKNDPLPKEICGECLDKLVEFRNFKTMCINSRIEFLKESVAVGLVEAENSTENLVAEKPALIDVDSTGIIDDHGQEFSATDPLAEEVEEQVQTVSQTEMYGVESSLPPQETPVDVSQYLERRLDDSIGTLKPCDAPNCKKVFSSYKALVIHKKSKHTDVYTDGSTVGVVHTKRSSVDSFGGGSSVDGLGEEEGAVYIEEFLCPYPNCGNKLPNLSSLLSHQATHPPTDSFCGVVLGNEEVVMLTDEDVESMDDQQFVESSPVDEDSVKEPSTLGDTSEACASSSNSIPEEPEFLCHWQACGQGFHTFEKLLQHRKAKHSTDRGVSLPAVGSKPSKVRYRQELKGLLQDNSKMYLCKNPGCSKEFVSMRKILAHRESCPNKLGSSRVKKPGWKKAKKHPVVAQGIRQSDKQGTRETCIDQEKGSGVVKMEPNADDTLPQDTVSQPVREPGVGSRNWGVEEFECEAQNCTKVFETFSALQKHFDKAHNKKKATHKKRKAR